MEPEPLRAQLEGAAHRHGLRLAHDADHVRVLADVTVPEHRAAGHVALLGLPSHGLAGAGPGKLPLHLGDKVQGVQRELIEGRVQGDLPAVGVGEDPDASPHDLPEDHGRLGLLAAQPADLHHHERLEGAGARPDRGQDGVQPRGLEELGARDSVVLVDNGTYWLGSASEWSGLYVPGYGQRVSACDARALGAALQRALPDVPEEDAFEQMAPTRGGRGTSLERTLRRNVRRQTSPLELYGGEEKDVLRSLIAHCHDCIGGFWIWSYESR